MKSEWFEPTEEDALDLERELLHLEMVEELCRVMEEQGVTRAELAQRCGISPSALSQRLSGRKYMTTGTLAQMAHALGKRYRAQLVDEDAPLAQPSPPSLELDEMGYSGQVTVSVTRQQARPNYPVTIDSGEMVRA